MESQKKNDILPNKTPLASNEGALEISAQNKIQEMADLLSKGRISQKDYTDYVAYIEAVKKKNDGELQSINAQFEAEKIRILKKSAQERKSGNHDTMVAGSIKSVLYFTFGGIEQNQKENNDVQNFSKGVIDEALAFPEVVELLITNPQVRAQFIDGLKNILSWDTIKSIFDFKVDTPYEAGRTTVYAFFLLTGVGAALKATGKLTGKLATNMAKAEGLKAKLAGGTAKFSNGLNATGRAMSAPAEIAMTGTRSTVKGAQNFGKTLGEKFSKKSPLNGNTPEVVKIPSGKNTPTSPKEMVHPPKMKNHTDFTYNFGAGERQYRIDLFQDGTHKVMVKVGENFELATLKNGGIPDSVMRQKSYENVVKHHIATLSNLSKTYEMSVVGKVDIFRVKGETISVPKSSLRGTSGQKIVVDGETYRWSQKQDLWLGKGGKTIIPAEKAPVIDIKKSRLKYDYTKGSWESTTPIKQLEHNPKVGQLPGVNISSKEFSQNFGGGVRTYKVELFEDGTQRVLVKVGDTFETATVKNGGVPKYNTGMDEHFFARIQREFDGLKAPKKNTVKEVTPAGKPASIPSSVELLSVLPKTKEGLIKRITDFLRGGQKNIDQRTILRNAIIEKKQELVRLDIANKNTLNTTMKNPWEGAGFPEGKQRLEETIQRRKTEIKELEAALKSDKTQLALSKDLLNYPIYTLAVLQSLAGGFENMVRSDADDELYAYDINEGFDISSLGGALLPIAIPAAVVAATQSQKEETPSKKEVGAMSSTKTSENKSKKLEAKRKAEGKNIDEKSVVPLHETPENYYKRKYSLDEIKALKAIVLSQSSPSPSFEKEDIDAVCAYQELNGYVVDGKIGKYTLSGLNGKTFGDYIVEVDGKTGVLKKREASEVKKDTLSGEPQSIQKPGNETATSTVEKDTKKVETQKQASPDIEKIFFEKLGLKDYEIPDGYSLFGGNEYNFFIKKGTQEYQIIFTQNLETQSQSIEIKDVTKVAFEDIADKAKIITKENIQSQHIKNGKINLAYWIQK